MKNRFVTIVVLAGLFGSPALAQTPSTTTSTERQDEANSEDKEVVIGKLKLGLGLGMVLDVGSVDRIDEAQLVGGVVRVTDEGNNTIRPIFEGHVFAWGSDKVVFGPFVGVQLDEGSVVSAFGAGIMTGVRVSKQDQTLNFGLGAFLDPDVRTLGNGIVEDKPLPAGETEIRYRKRAQWGILFMASYGF